MMLTNSIRNMSSPWIELLRPEDATRSTVSWGWDSTQTLREHAVDEAVRDYDPADGTFRGLRAEESRTYSLLDNRDLSTGNWNDSFSPLGSISKNAVGLDGVANSAHTLTDDDASGAQFIAQNGSVPDDTNPVKFTVYIQKDNNESRFPQFYCAVRGGSDLFESVRINTKTGAADEGLNSGTFSVEDAGGFWRVVIEITNDGSGNTTTNYRFFPALNTQIDGNGSLTTGSAVVDFGNIEQGVSFDASPYEVGGTAATRAEDVIESAFSYSSGTIHIEGEHKGGDGVLWQADDTTTNNRLRLEVSSGNVQLVVDDGGTNQATLNAGALASNGLYNVAFRFGSSDFAISLDGAAEISQASGTMPTLTVNRFGRDTTGTVGVNWFKKANYRVDNLTNLSSVSSS